MYAKTQSQKQNQTTAAAARSMPTSGRPLVSASLQSPVWAEDFRRLQQTVGNRVIQRMLAGNDADTQPIQAMRQELGDRSREWDYSSTKSPCGRIIYGAKDWLPIWDGLFCIVKSFPVVRRLSCSIVIPKSAAFFTFPPRVCKDPNQNRPTI
jgi:hypothetical protein